MLVGDFVEFEQCFVVRPREFVGRLSMVIMCEQAWYPVSHVSLAVMDPKDKRHGKLTNFLTRLKRPRSEEAKQTQLSNAFGTPVWSRVRLATGRQRASECPAVQCDLPARSDNASAATRKEV